MPKRSRAPFVALVDLLARRRPDVDPSAIADGRVLVDGRVLMNPGAWVRRDASVRVRSQVRLRGEVKLAHALEVLQVSVAGRVAADIGANVGGFVTALLDRGVRRVYAVDAGVGQLLGRLRIDPRVVNLDGHNLGTVTRADVPDVLDLITVDVSYSALVDAVPQLNRLDIGGAADLVALVKPTFELRRGRVAASADDVVDASAVAAAAIVRSGWRVVATCDAPATGRRGAREAFIHARRVR